MESSPKSNTLTIHTNVSRDLVSKFDLFYKGCRSRFIRNAMQLAVEDKVLFDKIFFKDLILVNG